MNKYEIELNLNEQRMALTELADSVMRSANNIKKHRTMRQSEKAMALSSLLIKATALQMAIDRIDGVLTHEEANPEGISSLMAG